MGHGHGNGVEGFMLQFFGGSSLYRTSPRFLTAAEMKGCKFVIKQACAYIIDR